MKSGLEEDLLFLIRLYNLPEPDREYRFRPERRWRFDFAWPEVKVYVEVEGGTFTGGRHVRPVSYSRDCEKYNAATLDGWAGLRFTTDMLRDDPVGCCQKLMLLLDSKGVPVDFDPVVPRPTPADEQDQTKPEQSAGRKRAQRGGGANER